MARVSAWDWKTLVEVRRSFFFGYNARATGTIANEPGRGSAPDNRFGGTGLLLYALRSSSSVPTISRRYRIAVLREHWHWSIISRSDGLGPWFSRS